jgi:AraC-like DNA-binding protein
VAVTRPRDEEVRIAVHHPLPGVLMKRFVADVHLFRAYPEHFSTVLHLAGHSDWSVRGVEWQTRPGTVGAKVPGEVYIESARDGRGEFQVIVFEDQVIAEARAVLGREYVAPGYTATGPDDPRAQALRAMHVGLRTADPSEREQLLVEGLTALVELTCVATPERFGASIAVARARALLDERITETVSLDELATHARLDKFRLCRAFREEVGVPPHAYVTQRRVSLAQGLLARGVAQAEIAARVGLYDQSQLHRHFKRIVGVTPGAYARAVR